MWRRKEGGKKGQEDVTGNFIYHSLNTTNTYKVLLRVAGVLEPIAGVTMSLDTWRKPTQIAHKVARPTPGFKPGKSFLVRGDGANPYTPP